ncbi:hypothetical protein BDM02DRAFT_3194049 [Thelephora ganbajun]|uniref:Uncharacterized protein n=1 Tax=Thelephora ganbajun TaxID=370292 RepID=A0ACB6YXP7_THEGA|nr:hypothetical protein BDM02DRAFT_3194049 [Thelephora ganbajun]
MAPMEVNLTTDEEFITPPSLGVASDNTSTTNISQARIQVETPELVILEVTMNLMGAHEGRLVPTEDEVAVVEEEVPEPVGIILPAKSFNWQDERAQAREAYYWEVFPDVVRADELRYSAWYGDGRPTGDRGPLDAGPSGVPRDD